MVIAFLVALGMNAFAYWNSDKMVLRMYGAQEIAERDDPDLFGLVRELARRAQIPMPKVYIIENAQPNAFATGRDPGARRGRRHDGPACSACRVKNWRACSPTNSRTSRTATR